MRATGREDLVALEAEEPHTDYYANEPTRPLGATALKRRVLARLQRQGAVHTVLHLDRRKWEERRRGGGQLGGRTLLVEMLRGVGIETADIAAPPPAAAPAPASSAVVVSDAGRAAC